MKRMWVLFLQTGIVLIAAAAIFVLIRFPLTEGRAKDLDLLRIYADPFILYGYAVSILFFVALYKAFRLVGYAGQKEVFSTRSVKSVQILKRCAGLLAFFIVMAGVFIWIYHNKDDDPAGFLAMCAVTAFASVLVAIAAARFEKWLGEGAWQNPPA